jgi:hypothetical protein
VYRPPPSKKNGFTTKAFFTEWEKYLESHSLSSGKLLITGDLNFHIDSPSDKDAKRFLKILDSLGMTQHVNEPTHQQGHTLDVVISRDSDKLIRQVQVLNQEISDHSAVCFNLCTEKPPNLMKNVKYRKLRSINTETFKFDLANSSLQNHEKNMTETIDELVNKYNTTLLKVVDDHAPVQHKTITLRPNAPWYTEELREAKHERRRRERLWRKSRLEIDHQFYKEQCNIVKSMLKKAKCQYYSSKIMECANDQKALFKIINKLLHRKDQSALPSFSSPGELANRFAHFFSDKIVQIRENLTSSAFSSAGQTEHVLDTKRFQTELSTLTSASSDEVERIILKSASKSCDLDPVPTWLLKQCLNILLPFIVKLVNLSLSTSTMPTEFKTAILRPLLKKPSLDCETLKNFRPVSNLPFISKVIEKVVAERFHEHMKSNGLYESMQSAYRKYHSTETALLKVQNDILEAVDEGSVAVLVLLDLSAAFDTIDHEKLLDHLQNRLGITGDALAWFRSYLTDRHQSVQIEGEKSDPLSLLFGVPQGSVLGPLMFTVYTSPLGDLIRHHGYKHHFYADDSQLFLAFKPGSSEYQQSSLSSLENCISDVRIWMKNNMLKLNDDKTELLVFSTKQKLAQLSKISMMIGGCRIEPSKTAKNLGVFFDETMSLEKHVVSTCQTANFHIRNIGNIRNYLTTDAAKSLVHAFVQSRLDYGNALLFGLPGVLLDRLQMIQNTAARVVTRTRRFDHITPVLKELHWLPIKKRIEYKVLLHTYRALNNLAPQYLTDLLEIYQPARELRSQNQILLKAKKSRLHSYGDRCFSTAAPKLWNALPLTIRASKSLAAFRKSLKTHLFQKHYLQ